MVVSSNKDSPTVLPCLYLIKRAWNRPNSSNSCGKHRECYYRRPDNQDICLETQCFDCEHEKSADHNTPSGGPDLLHGVITPTPNKTAKDNLQADHTVARQYPLARGVSISHRWLMDTPLANGYCLATVMMNLYSLHMDPVYWPDPDRFDPGRFLDAEGNVINKPESFMPFSGGRRVCLGEQLARMELFLFFSTLLQSCTFQPPEDAPGPTTEGGFGLTLKPHPFKLCAIPQTGKPIQHQGQGKLCRSVSMTNDIPTCVGQAHKLGPAATRVAVAATSIILPVARQRPVTSGRPDHPFWRNENAAAKTFALDRCI
ncbi:hypothetical protein Bbelb_119440 [Branchiostoma belcheri]|nr:hypothetical protein Bbelb_119440 [Branchiostoma belcheri]